MEEETTASPSYEAVQQYYQQLAQLPKAQLPKAQLPKAQLPKAQLPKAQLAQAQANYYHDDNQAQNQQGGDVITDLFISLCPSPVCLPLSHANRNVRFSRLALQSWFLLSTPVSQSKVVLCI